MNEFISSGYLRASGRVELERTPVQAIEKSQEQIQVIRDVQDSLGIDEVKEKARNTKTMESLQKMRQEVASVFGSDEQ